MTDRVVRLAAVGDLHCTRGSRGTFQPLFGRIAEAAELLLLAGDLTDRGLPEEAHVLAGELAAAQLPTVAVLGNHDFESDQQAQVREVLAAAGVTVLDGEAYETLGIGIAGVKGFAGGFGQRALGAWGEAVVKGFVHEALNEALKLEAALARCERRTFSRCYIIRPCNRRSWGNRLKSTRSSVRADSRNR